MEGSVWCRGTVWKHVGGAFCLRAGGSRAAAASAGPRASAPRIQFTADYNRTAISAHNTPDGAERSV